MTTPFVVRLALREGRSSMRRLGLYMSAITLGVAALVAINAYRANIVDTVRADARRLLGADVRLQSDRPFPDSAEAVVDSLRASGARLARVTATLAMGVVRPLDAPDSGSARLVQLRAVEEGYPFYDSWQTNPPDLWATLAAGGAALVEPSLLLQTGARVGDSIQLGAARFRIAGTVENLPAELGFRSAAGPRVFIPHRRLAETELVTLGSIVQHQVFAAVAGAREAERFADRNRERLRRQQVGVETAEEQGQEIAEAVDALSRFLGLVGLTALLLGGLGVGSAVNLFVRDKRIIIATLRCIGATRKQAFLAYLLQAGILGLAGAAAGVVLGLLVQLVLPFVLRGALPVDVAFRPRLLPIVSGLVVGVLVALLFALLPLLEVRGITPLQALRHEVEPARRRFDPARALALGALIAGVTGLAIWQAGDWRPGLAYAAAITLSILLLLACATLLIRGVRRWTPRGARFVIRQGIASLFRPHNQTHAVTVALGFGVFVLATMAMVQQNLLARFEVRDLDDQPNVLAFGIQRAQTEGVIALAARAGTGTRIEPIVTARIAAVNNVPTDTLLASARARDIEPWALRREYRNTYRSSLTSTETVIEGEWFDRGAGNRGDGIRSPARISIEDDVARSLGVGLGDTLTWDVQGRSVSSVITSIRDVDWARLDTNFFVVFEPGTLEDAPQSYVLLTRIMSDSARAQLQRALAAAYPGVTAIDLALVQHTLERIISRATLGIRFLGLFSVIGGILVLAGAVAASRFQRLREGVLLRTLGARASQIRGILLTEYTVLGALAGLAGGSLGIAAAWALTRFVFQLPFSLPLLPLLVTVGVTVLVSVAVGVAGSREVLRSTPLEVMRAAE